jgi:hypothetical protein
MHAVSRRCPIQAVTVPFVLLATMTIMAAMSGNFLLSTRSSMRGVGVVAFQAAAPLRAFGGASRTATAAAVTSSKNTSFGHERQHPRSTLTFKSANNKKHQAGGVTTRWMASGPQEVAGGEKTEEEKARLKEERDARK